VRVIRACHTLGIEAVVGVSEADADTLAARLADDVAVLGPPLAARAILRADKIVEAALRTGCATLCTRATASCPSARPSVRACVEAGLVFVGPLRRGHRRDGRQDHRRQPGREGRRARACPGSGALTDVAHAKASVRQIGYPGAHQGDGRRRRARHAHRPRRKASSNR
jgi:acetyl-CoA carboxylase biotin carboxylase subunit